jgi:beta-lactam-binding protein with PASTA domain
MEHTHAVAGHSVPIRWLIAVVIVVVLALGAWWAFPATPEVRGMTGEQAQRELEAAGFDVVFAVMPPPYRDVKCFQRSDVGEAIGQDPCPGRSLDAHRGSLVTVWIRTGHVACKAPPGWGCA